MAHQIKNIKERLDKVAADGNKFGLVKIDVGPELVLSKREMTHSHVDASSVIGRVNEREEIIKLLGDDGDQRFCVIPIVGIGGLGKTTLAKLVFNDGRMDELFSMKMWVCVSDDFDIRQIIIKIINSASASTFTPASVALAHQENINNLDIEDLQSRLRHILSGQKFLLVLDDIWNDDRAKWIELMDLIKDDAAGNKIIVTTRSNSIATMMGTISSYILDGLSPEDCLSLFVKWAFKEGEVNNYLDLVEIGKEIVKKCAGVPLAAVRSLGSALFLKYDLNKWILVRDSEIWNLEQKKYDILPALKLSYDQMSFYLRKCFAFFSLYPKDNTFYGSNIINMWVALGFVKSRIGSDRLKDIAREYIDELSSRSFLQDLNDYGYNVSFKVHDLIHDLALYVAKEDFVAINSNTRNIPEQVTHISVVENNSLENVLFPKSKSLRTILFPIKDVGLDNQILLDTWISRYKYLRYLDLGDSCIETLPNSISKLEHLRVLDLEKCKIKRLPHSICKLHNLQDLRLHGCRELEILPRGLGRLISLRELSITTKQSVLSLIEFTNLNHLQALYFVECENMKFVFNEAQQLTSLKTLYVQSCGSIESLPLFIFPNLHSLIIVDCEMLNLSLYNENSIQRLKINHLVIGELTKLVTLPEWIEGLVDTLETLSIFKLPNLKTLPECLTTMTHLKRLHIVDCPQLLSFTSDLHRLTALEDFRIYGCPELCRKCQPQSGEYWPMIAHIKKTFIGEP